MADQERPRKGYEKPQLADIEKLPGELSEDDLDRVSGGSTGGTPACRNGGQTDICAAGSSGVTPEFM